MPSKHHLYNFHIGFWNAILITLALVLQSSLFIVFGTAFTSAQTTSAVTFISPQNGQSFLASSTVNISVQTPQALNVVFEIIDNQNRKLITIGPTPADASKTVWNGSWLIDATMSGNFTIKAVVNLQVGQTIEESVSININAPIVVDVLDPLNGDSINGTKSFKATTNNAVDTLRFELTGSTGQSILFNANRTSGNDWEYIFNSSTFQPDDYTLKAIATKGTVQASSAPISITIGQNLSIQLISVPATWTGTVTVNARASVALDQGQSMTFNVNDANGTVNQNYIGTSTDQINWTASIDSTVFNSGTYALVAFGPINQTNISSAVTPIVVANGGGGTVQTNVLKIDTTALNNGVQNVAYSTTLRASGGTSPYSWAFATSSGSLPAGLQLNSNGTIAGTPRDNGTFTFRLRVQDNRGVTAERDLSLTIAAAPATTTIPVPSTGSNQTTTQTPTDSSTQTTTNGTTAQSTISISSPSAGTSIFGNESLVVITTSVEARDVKLSVRTLSGGEVANVAAFKPSGDTTNKKFNVLLDTTKLQNREYNLMAKGIASTGGTALQSEAVQVGVDNSTTVSQEEEFRAVITAPTNRQEVRVGTVRLEAQVLSSLKARSLTFRLQTPKNGVISRVATYNSSTDRWESSWEAATITPGSVAITANAVTDRGEVKSLPQITINLISLTTTSTPQTTEPVVQLPVEQVIPKQVLETVNQEVEQAGVPVECQLVGIKNESDCTRYLTARSITLLDDAEQQTVRQDLKQVVGQHVTVENGKVVRTSQLTLPSTQRKQEDVSKPLQTILPVDITRSDAAGTSLLVIESSEPPAYIKPFVEQTVPAVVIFDKDGDGLSDEAEARYGTDPNNPDSDNDGFQDGTEVKNGYDPLGSGRLQRNVAPIDLAILNGKPLDQPKFAGAIDEERLKVDGIRSVQESSVAGDSSKQLRFSGRAEANSVITLYIYSAMPVVVSVATTETGEWEYDMRDPLVDGKHEVYVTVTNENGKVERKSTAFGFFVQAAQAVSEDQYLQSTTVQNPDSAFFTYYIAGAIVIAILAGLLFFFYLKKRSHNTYM